MNGICHVEIPSKDFAMAKKFYGEVFGWECRYIPEMDYMTFKTPDGVGGGFDKDREISLHPGIEIYIEVEDIDATIKKTEAAGGTCVKGKTQISQEMGYYALIVDMEGNQLGLWAKN